MNEIIMNELREYARNPFFCVTQNEENFVLSIACKIDERFTHELEAKQAEIDALKFDNAYLQKKLDASILPPVDINGNVWTCEDVDKPFSLTDGDKATGGIVREIAYGWPRKGWFIVDQYDTHYPAGKCRHVAHEQTDSQERIDVDAEKGACDYFGRSNTQPCDGCPAYDGATRRSCMILQKLDLLRRQRKLDGAGEQA